MGLCRERSLLVDAFWLERLEADLLYSICIVYCITETQSIASTGMLNMPAEAIAINQSRVSAWERSIEEVKIEWNFYG